MPDDREIPNRTVELGEIVWRCILDLERVYHLRKRPSLERRLKVAHAMAQLSGAYLKVAEAADLSARLAQLEAVVEGLRHHEGSNGH
jgi:hypothetical protein